MAEKVVTGEVRLSYVTLFEPKAITEGGPLKYSVSILIPKDDTETLPRLEKAIEKVIANNQSTLKTKKQSALKLPLRDGDEEKDSPDYEGHYFISVSSKTAPMVVDEDRQQIVDPREIYSGCYGRVSMNLYAFNKAGNKGIGCGLNAVQKTGEGEALGGAYTADDLDSDFGDDLL